MSGGFGHDGLPPGIKPLANTFAMDGDEGATLQQPPPKDASKAPIENTLEVTAMGVLGPDIFTNTRKPWHPPGARGIYGGAVIAQCLSAAQHTVSSDFAVHSCHCYFLLAGMPDTPILYHVERLRDGRSYSTRTVQARQRGRCIFTTTVSFMRATPALTPEVRHAVPLPPGVVPPSDDYSPPTDEFLFRSGPFETAQSQVILAPDASACKCRQWMRARGTISASGGRAAHLDALAYMSDSYFIGTVSRIHRLWRWPFKPHQLADLSDEAARAHITRINQLEGMGAGPQQWATRPTVGMMVSLDHSIYFHEPLRVRADEWIFVEMDSPWAGDGRGVVMQRIFAKDGTLLATCVQEGVIRLKPDGSESSSKL
ncbi:hypothetical protein CDD81_5110 [Ophiocordyceps australis]|uniref:Acyl-CoA thioesterase II n=1 Tax=Ophiocordyceps australis TaxID=1399860 RepID=A0A2C5Y3E5_9HYPO|nr:hypothetical protein CDD81_5110 [Ophiocordyceps australis]